MNEEQLIDNSMNRTLTPQERMDAAFDNYLALSEILREDLIALLESKSESQHWRRNYVRVSASLIEGYANSFREMCSVSSDCISPELSRGERKVLSNESSVDTYDRIKCTVSAAYKRFKLQPKPHFDGPEWVLARRVLDKRHLLMHPKAPADLTISDDFWNELQDGVTWLIEQFFNFVTALQTKYGHYPFPETDA